MYYAIRHAVDSLFESLPFSVENEQHKEKLLSAAKQKYDRDLEEGISPSEAAGRFLLHAGTVEAVSEYLRIDFIPDPTPVLPERSFERSRKRITILLHELALLIAFWSNSFISLLLNRSWPALMYTLILWSVLGFLLYLILKRKNRLILQEQIFTTSFPSSCGRAAKKKYELYSKKLTNTVFGIFSLCFILLFSVVLSIVSFRYSLTETVNTINFYLSFILLAIYLTLKNYFCRKFYAAFFSVRQNKEYLRELQRICLFSLCYYLLAFILLLLFRNKTETIFSFALAAIGLYLVLAVFYNFTRRRRFMVRNITLNIRKTLCYTLAVACFITYNFMKLDLYLLQPYINTISAVEHVPDEILYDEDTGVYTIMTEKDQFKILQLTDIHLGGSVLSVSQDTKALKACYQLIRATDPDLVIVTGDLVFPMGVMSFSLNNNAPIMQFANFMRNIGIPWAFTYGNHDTESLATLSRTEVDSLLKALSYKSSKNLLYPYIQPDIYGRSNQMIEIRHSGGSLMQALFLIDSNDYAEAGGINEYDYIHDDQVAWYCRTLLNLSAREEMTVPSMIFTHIPLQEYKIANDLYEEGSEEVIYHYGVLGESMIDKICCSNYPSKLFDAAVRLGSTQAIFCGHDHYNNQSLEYKGIRLTYGYSIDYLAMPGIEDDTEQRGATLITLDKDGTYDIRPCRLIDLPEHK